MVRSRTDEMQSEDPLNGEWPNEAEQPSLSQILAQLEEHHAPDKTKNTSACSEAGSSETDNPPAKRQLLSGKL